MSELDSRPIEYEIIGARYIYTEKDAYSFPLGDQERF